MPRRNVREHSRVIVHAWVEEAQRSLVLRLALLVDDGDDGGECGR